MKNSSTCSLTNSQPSTLNYQLKKDDGLSLPKSWEIKKLGEVCEILDKLRKPITKKNRTVGNYPYYGATGILDYVHDFIFNEKLILIGEDGAKWNSGDRSSFIVMGKYWVNNHAHVVRPDREIILDNWIVYFLNFSDLSKYITGLTVPKLNQGKLKSIEIPLPPLPEQQRIVSILDKAFAAIDKAKQNAEQNLRNAKEVFESYLQGVFENKDDDWEEKTLGEVCEITTGKLNANAMVDNGRYAFFTCSRESYLIDTYAFDCEAILLAGNNASGDFNVKHYKGKFNAYQRTYVITVKDNYNINYSLLKHRLKYHLKDFKRQSVGANTRFLKIGMIKNVNIMIPTFIKQKHIVRKLDKFSFKIKKLEVIYQQKLENLDKLKKSILQKAFNGEL